MKRIHNLGTEAWPGGAGDTPVQLEPIPDGFGSDSYKVTTLSLDLKMTVTAAAGGGASYLELLQWVRFFLNAGDDPVANLNGMSLYMFTPYTSPYMWVAIMTGAAGMTPADVDPDGQVTRHLPLCIPFEVFSGFRPLEFCYPAAIFNRNSLHVQWGAAALNGNVTVDSASISVWATVERKNDVSVPATPSIREESLNPFCQLEPGIYDVLFIRKPDATTAFAAGDLTSIFMSAAGESIHAAINGDGLYAAYAFDKGVGMPATSWSDDAASALYVPLIWPGQLGAANQVNQYVDTQGGSLKIDIQSDEDALVFVSRKYRPLTPIVRDAKLAQMGIANPAAAVTNRKTASKATLPTATVARRPGLSLIPYKVQGVTTLEAAGNQASKIPVLRR